MNDEGVSGRQGRDESGREAAGNEDSRHRMGSEAAGNGVPEWWPYATELPAWHVWRGISGLVYARRINSSPPMVVRGEDAVDLRDAIRREEFLRSI